MKIFIILFIYYILSLIQSKKIRLQKIKAKS